MGTKHIKKIDPTFKRKFGIDTPIIYLEYSIIEKGCEKQFERSWKRFYHKAEPIISDFRIQRFQAFFRQLAKEKNDDHYTERVAIKFISPKVGYGVFAKKNIAPYSTLGHYTGIFRPDKEIELSHDSTFAFTDYKSFSIDAVKMGNWTRFMNHGEEKMQRVNVISWEYYDEKEPRIVFTSGPRGIKKGEQLLYSYGESYWEDKKFLTLS